ncbi:transposase [cyanobacterium TDX16]|nr:transposase [cyanobacterium TDX16]
MTVKKLTEADRTEILDLYRNTGETTSTLADRYGVSNSTISRFLKVTLPEDEYETLIAAKRAARTPGGVEKEEVTAIASPVVEVPSPTLEAPILKTISEPEPVVEATTPKPVKKRRSTAKTGAEIEPLAEQLELLSNPSLPVEEVREEVSAQASEIAAIMVGEELLDEDEDEDDEDDDLEDLEDLDEDDDFEEETTPVIRRRLPVESFVRVLPLSEAMLPRTCYIVIDRMAELITRPLRDFGDLGQIPVQEVQQKTLPIFDNHRVARRFSSKRDRVIKVPDSRMLQKTRSQLQSKGITRLLFDGRVYSLSSS